MRYATVAFFLCAGMMPAMTLNALAQPPAPPHERHSVLNVTGMGSVSVAPDLARVTSGVVSTAETARDALTYNNQAMKKVLDGLKSHGIEAKDIMTTNFTVSPQYTYDDEAGKRLRKPQLIGYEVRNSVHITVRDMKKLGAILDATVSNGANSIDDISFDVENASALQDTARKKAIEDAQRKAQILATASKMTLGKIRNLSENNAGGIVRPRMMMDAMKSAAPESVPVEQGELNLSAHVDIQWELLP